MNRLSRLENFIWRQIDDQLCIQFGLISHAITCCSRRKAVTDLICRS